MSDRIVTDSALEEKGKKRARAFNKLGNNYLRENLLDDAIAAFTKALQCDQAYSTPHNNLGIIYLEQKKYPEAIEAFKNAILIDPESSLYYCNLGAAYDEAGMDEIALEAFLAAVQTDHNSHLGYFSLGAYYQAHGKYTLALENYKKTTELRPKFAQGYVNQGTMHYFLSGLSPLSWRKKQQAICLDYNAQMAHALAAYNMALEIDPKCEDAYYHLGLLYQEIAHYDEAIQSFKKLISLNDKSEQAEIAKNCIDQIKSRQNDPVA